MRIEKRGGCGFGYKIVLDDATPREMPIIGKFNDIDKKFYDRIRPYINDGRPKSYKIIINEFTAYLAEVVNLINGIDYEDKRKKVGDPIKTSRYRFTNKFIKKSAINWDDAYNINDYIFKYRFLTLILMMYIENMSKYVSMLSKKKYRMDNLIRIIEQMRSIIPIYMSSSSYKNALLLLQQKIVVFNKIGNSMKVNSDIRDMIENLVCTYKKNSVLEDSEDVPDDITMDSLFKLAYLLTTNNRDFGNLPKFDKFEDMQFSDDCDELIKELGKSIYKSHKEITYPDMFQAFILANPLMYVNGDKKNDNLMMGRAALLYTDLICNDKNIHKIINKVMMV